MHVTNVVASTINLDQQNIKVGFSDPQTRPILDHGFDRAHDIFSSRSLKVDSIVLKIWFISLILIVLEMFNLEPYLQKKSRVIKNQTLFPE